MNNNEYKKIEEEIKNLYLNADTTPLRKKLLFGFWTYHVLPVLEYSNQMAIKYNAEVIVVRLGALLHDMALITDEEPHDEIGARKAYYMLVSDGVDEVTASKIRDVILKHRCKVYVPETLEEKIVATADALAHFFPNVRKNGVMEIAREDYLQINTLDIEKLEREYGDKVFFADEKKIFQKLIREYQKNFYQND